jgi:chemotaxis protein MotB
VNDHGGDEFVSISDLMAGFVGVIVMLLVVSMAQNAAQVEARRREVQLEAERRRAEEARRELEARRPIDDAFDSIRRALDQSGASASLIDVDVGARTIRLRDATFAPGSACVAPAAQVALGTVNQMLSPLLEGNPALEISVVGHTDSDPVGTRGGADRCAMFDDNLTLSASRAREARAVVVEGWPEARSRRVSVSGYGDMRPLDVANPTADVNRRVEISLQEVN